MLGQAMVTIGENQWNVEVATTISELATGLSGRASIPAGTGMLFVLPTRQVITVTTTQMLFLIDIIFIKDNLVLDIAQNIEPGLLVEEATPCDGFLEINAGEADLVEVGDAVSVEITTPAPTPGFDFSSIMSFAIPLVVLGLVSGMLFEGSSKKELSSGGHHSNGKNFTWQIINHAVGEKHESLVSYKDRTYTLGSAYNFVEDELKVGHPKPSEKGYEIKIIDSKGEVVYTEWYIPSWMLYEVGKCPKHPTCKAWVVYEGKRICYECWNESKRPHSIQGEWIYANVGSTEMRGRKGPSGIEFEQVSDTYDRAELQKAVEEIERKIKEGHSIHGEPRKRLVDKYGSWAVGRAEAICGEDDIACVTKEAKRLSETLKARYGGEGMEYVTIISPGQTVFHIGDVVSEVAVKKENRRVRALGETEATYQ